MPVRQSANDPLLAPLFASGGGAEHDRAIQQILTRHARPQVDRLLAEEMERGRLATIDGPDLANEISLRLLRRLHRLARDPLAEPIARLSDYVGATTHNAVDDHRRRQDPLRSRLASRVRYVLTHTPRLALWGREPLLCGLATWSDRQETKPVAAPGALVGTIADDAKELRRVILEVIERSGGPVGLRALVSTLATALGLAAEPFVPAAALARLTVASDPLGRLEGRQYLGQLWKEIAELPVRQRRAMMLQLRLDDGESVSRLLAALGIVSVRNQAEVLAMPLAELAGLWNDLPLDDQRIAGMLGIRRQQVINLRKSARERLARRMGRPR